MIRALVCLATLLWGTVASAQFLDTRAASLIESQLSGDGRIVKIEGFAGALSTRATIERLTIADDQGVWLVMDNAVLQWTASALLDGRLQVEELSAARLDIRRTPVADDSIDVPDAQASGFRVPDLPVAIRIGTFSIPDIRLGAPVLGEAVTASVMASAALAAGGLDIDLNAQRTDGAGGTAVIIAKFTPASEVLTLRADIQEPAQGVLARALSLPGLPSVRLEVEGQGPLDDFASDITLATDGQTRLDGQVILARAGTSGRRFSAQLGGDIRPLLPPDNRAFFGPQTALSAQGLAGADGGFALDALRLQTAQLDLSGAAQLAPGAVPQSFDLRGTVQGQLPGTDVTTAQTRLSLTFDAATSPDWSLVLQADDVRLPDLSFAGVTVRGTGVILPGDTTPFEGQIQMAATGASFADAALQTAIGSDLTLQTGLSVRADGTTTLTDLQADLAHVALTGDATATPAEGRMVLRLDTRVVVPDMAGIGPLIAPLQQGRADMRLQLSMDLPGGALDVELTGNAQDLDIGQPRLAPLVSPQTNLSLAVRRDETGTVLDRLTLQNPALTLSAAARIIAQDGSAQMAVTLTDVATLVPDLPAGPLTLTATVNDLLTNPNVIANLTDTHGTTADVTATLTDQTVVYDALLDIPRLRAFAALTAPLTSGALQGRFVGMADIATGALTVNALATSRALDIGQPMLAPLLAPQTQLTFDLRHSDAGTLLDNLTLQNPELTLTGRAQMQDQDASADLQATLADVARLVPDLPGGALTLTVTGADLLTTPNVRALLRDTYGTQVDVTATLTQNTTLDYTAILDAPRLSSFARVAAPLRAGAVSGTLRGSADIQTGAGSVTARATSRALDIGVPFLAPLLTAQTQLDATVRRAADGAMTIDQARLRSSELSVDASGRVAGAQRDLALTARLTNLGRLVPTVPGRLDLTGTLAGDRVSAALSSATGARAQVDGRIGLPQGGVDLTATGRAPLALAGPFIGRRVLTGMGDFDLAMRGAPGLQTLSGRVTTADLRLADPALGFVLSPARASVQLAQGRAQIDLEGALNDAPLTLRGGVTLSAPFAIDLATQVRALPYAFEDIARVTIGADLTLRGAAQTQLAIAGDVRLSGAEIRVPDSGLGSVDPVPVIRHLNAPAKVRQTLARADLLDRDRGGGTPLRLPLNITVTALDPVFVRGRGLDAEFGGALRLGGTVSDPEPVGRFDLRRGRLSFLGQRLNLTEGAITAAGSLIPRLRIVAEAVTADVTAQIILDGPADAPELILTSQPELPQDEVLARLLFGRDVSSLSAFQVARLISSLATLSSGKPGLLDNTRMLFGFDDLDIRTDAATGETELAIGQYISENIYSEVELGARGDAQINLNLDLTDTTRLRGSVNSEGGTGIGVFWEKDY